MTLDGTPAPAELAGDRPAIAQWYAEQLPAAAGDEDRVSDLLRGALAAGAIFADVAVSWCRVPVPLSTVFSDYRRRPGGEADKTDAWVRQLQPGGETVGVRRWRPRPRDGAW